MPRTLFPVCFGVVRLGWLVVLLAALSACAYSHSQEPRTIVLGLMTPEGSELSSVATAMRNGANLAVDEVNEQGGLLVGDVRYRLVLVVEDDRNVPDQAVEAARSLILGSDARAIVGPATSRTALATAALVESLRVPMISPTATHPDLTAGRQYVFRVAFSDTFQGQAMAEFALNSLALTRAAVLYDLTNSYNEGVAEIFRSHFVALGGDVVAFESYLVGEDNFRSQLARIRAAEPDLIFLPNFPNDVLRQAQQAREMGITAVFLGSDSWEWQRLAPEPALDGAFFSNHYNPEQNNPDSRAFVSAYQTRYNALPTGGAALTYDAFQLIFQAMQNERATDAEAVQRGLSAIDEFSGVTGLMRYPDGRRDPIRSIVVLQLIDQQARFFESIDP